MLAGAENKLFDWGGRRGGIEEFSVVVLVGLKADGLKEPDEIGLAPNTFRFESIGRVAELAEIIGVGGRDVVCVSCGGGPVGVAA